MLMQERQVRFRGISTHQEVLKLTVGTEMILLSQNQLMLISASDISIGCKTKQCLPPARLAFVRLGKLNLSATH